jgi:DNA-binding transcriptional LysR family regulator
MNLLHLEYFYYVAREGGYLNAARVLRIQQPAISRMVKQLEESVGFDLFERVGRNVQLTARGRDVFEHSKKIFAGVSDLQSAVGLMRGTPQGPLSFAAAEPIASHLFPEVFEKLQRQHPDLYPIVFSGPASLLFDRIKNGELEFGLFFHIPDLPRGLSMTVLRKVRFYLVVRKDLCNQKTVLESFIGSREIDDTSTRTFPTLEKLQKKYPKASIRISANNLTAHRSLVLRGCGVAVLPDFLVEDDIHEGRLADVLPKERLEFNLKLIERSNSVPGLNARTFIDACSVAVQ